MDDLQTNPRIKMFIVEPPITGARIKVVGVGGGGSSVVNRTPEPPVDGFTDIVVVTPDGRVLADERDAVPGVLVRRSWRLATTADGTRVFEVSGALLESDADTPVDGPGGVRETTARTLDR